ncbi:MAG: hypothetical protein ABJE95_39740 [Byssovorax sp.]
MNRQRLGGHRGRLFTAAALGLAALASCAGAAPASETPPQVDPLTGPAPASDDAIEASKRVDRDKHEAPDAGPPADAGPGKAEPRCPYGELSDPHRGFVRCLAPDERDAGWLPPQPQAPPPSDAPPTKDPVPAPSTAPVASGPPPLVDIGAPKFENGEVPRAEKSLTKAATEIASCVADHGGLTGAAGAIKIQFLVRNRGRAEGVEVLSSKGVSPDAAACVRLLLKNKPIGPPSADPVGVTVTISLKPPSK